jgi:hypothetical protein
MVVPLDFLGVWGHLGWMGVYYFCQIAGAVILGNAFSFAFFMAAMKCSKLQKTGVKDDELPWWVYAGLMAAPGFMAVAAYSLTAS